MKPVKTYTYITRGRFILLNDALLSKLRIVILDPLRVYGALGMRLVRRRGVQHNEKFKNLHSMRI
ncbi:MAG: hypothetical protein LM583_03210 [Desulfurococcaceae archaeon]|nr:hypothetical protein [Desulfurococcaceae archaeon]